ncbi:hypothetical protein ABPG75_010201 [Micractinium tetrahymenae]
MSSQPLLGAERLRKSESSQSWEQNVLVLTLRCRPCWRRRMYENVFWLGTPVLLGVLLGLVLPAPQSLPEPFNRISSVIGWVYFCAWSISFYPQAFLNYRRKSVAGLSLDFQLFNMLGFSCYAVYNAALYWSPLVRREYACLNGGMMPAVHANDVFFALHAAVVTAITLVQCMLYDRGGQKVSWLAGLGTGGAVATIAAYLSAVVGAAAQSGGGGGPAPPLGAALGRAVPCGNILSWLSFLYFLSYIKLAVSLVKYIPQVHLNYKRQSTEGWNIHNILLDFGGGMLSLAQQVLDSVVNDCWSAITGNPVKFGLGFASMFFDVIFMAQHWCLYPAGGLQDCKAWAAAGKEGDGAGPVGAAEAGAVHALHDSAGSSPRSSKPAAAPLQAGSGSGGSGSGSEIGPQQDEGADLEAGGSGSGGVVLAADHTPLLR